MSMVWPCCGMVRFPGDDLLCGLGFDLHETGEEVASARYCLPAAPPPRVRKRAYEPEQDRTPCFESAPRGLTYLARARRAWPGTLPGAWHRRRERARPLGGARS